jgi:hypothetical protein
MLIPSPDSAEKLLKKQVHTRNQNESLVTGKNYLANFK